MHGQYQASEQESWLCEQGGGSGVVPGYPFPLTTSLWPEMALAAHPNLDQNIRKAVAEALFRSEGLLYRAVAESLGHAAACSAGHSRQTNHSLVFTYCVAATMIAEPCCMRTALLSFAVSTARGGARCFVTCVLYLSCSLLFAAAASRRIHILL